MQLLLLRWCEARRWQQLMLSKSGGQQIATGATVANVSQWRDSYLLRYTKPGGQYRGHQNAEDNGAENNFETFEIICIIIIILWCWFVTQVCVWVCDWHMHCQQHKTQGNVVLTHPFVTHGTELWPFLYTESLARNTTRYSDHSHRHYSKWSLHSWCTNIFSPKW